MAKAAGKLRQTVPHSGRRLGVKIYGGQNASPGNILIRQRGTVYHPGQGTRMGKDYTIFACKEGIVNFRQLDGKKLVEVA